MRDEFIRRGEVINVVDGDTIDAKVDLGYYASVTVRFRLLGIDTPEINVRDNAAGLIAKEYVRNKLLGQRVYIKSEKADSFGRWLCDVYYKNEEGRYVCLNTELLDVGLAELYKK